MSGTNAAAAKAKLVGTNNVLAGLSGMENVTVAYGMPRDVPREVVYGGDVGGPVDLAAMSGGVRIRRSEQLTFQLHIQVHQPGKKTTESSDTRVAAISALIENYIAANPTLGDLANLKLAAVTNVSLSGFLSDDGATSVGTLTVGLQSFLT